jgi:hypothetical protein
MVNDNAFTEVLKKIGNGLSDKKNIQAFENI